MTQQPYLISGQTTAPGAALAPRPRPSRLLRVIVIAWLLGGLIFLLFKMSSGHHTAQVEKTDSAHPSITAISVEDLLHHMDAVNSDIEAADAKLRRAQDQVNRSLPGVSRNYLFVEKNHLLAAVAITDAARQDLEHSRQEFELVLNSLKKEHQLQ